WIDREDHVLMPALVTYVLSHEDERRHDFALNSEAVLRNAWRRIARIDGRHALRHHRQLRRRERRSRLPTKERIAKRYIAETRCIRERRRGCDVVHVIALHPLEERAKPATQHGFASSREVIRETHARHVGVEVVLRHSARCSALPGNRYAVEIELRTLEGLKARTDGRATARNGCTKSAGARIERRN